MKFYIDFDGTIVDTISRICDIYNEDYSYYDFYEPVRPEDVQTWDFDELKLAKRKTINQYFTQPRFFNDNLKPMPRACDIINKLHDRGDSIIIVSTGSRPNLRLKKAWLRNHIRYNDFIGVDINVHKDKCHVNMKDGIFIDDMTMNLQGSNAMRNICYGNTYAWNADWEGERAKSWDDVYKLITEGADEL